jgi:hypothetical protein
MSNPLVRGMDLDVMKLGEVFARSGYFKDASDPAKAIVKILYGAELGIGPVASMMSIYIVEGKPAPSAVLLAAMVKRSRRYDYRVKQTDAHAAVIEFFQNGETLGLSSFTIQEAATAQLANRDNWKKYPKAMLFNRAMSQGVRMYCPDLFGGAPVYDAEELGAVVDADGDVVGSVPPLPPASPTIPHPQVSRTQAAIERFQQPVVRIPPYPGREEAVCEVCGTFLVPGQWTLSQAKFNRPLCTVCQKRPDIDASAKAAAPARAEDVVGVPNDELEMEVDPGGGVPREEREGEDEVPPAFRT